MPERFYAEIASRWRRRRRVEECSRGCCRTISQGVASHHNVGETMPITQDALLTLRTQQPILSRNCHTAVHFFFNFPTLLPVRSHELLNAKKPHLQKSFIPSKLGTVGSARSTCGHALCVCHGRMPPPRTRQLSRRDGGDHPPSPSLHTQNAVSLSLFTSRALAFLPDIIPRDVRRPTDRASLPKAL